MDNVEVVFSLLYEDVVFERVTDIRNEDCRFKIDYLDEYDNEQHATIHEDYVIDINCYAK